MKLYIFFLFLLLTTPVLAVYSTNFDITQLEVIGTGNAFIQFGKAIYFDANDERICARTNFNGKETANEKNCLCSVFAYDTCLDIFIKSEAIKVGGIGAGENPAVDYCLDSGTLMEGFVNGYMVDATYFAKIDCPPMFLCKNGQCEHYYGGKIGPSKNVYIDDNGNIIHADLVTIGETTLKEVENLSFTKTGRIIAKSFKIGDRKYKDVFNMSLDNKVITAENFSFNGFLLWNVSKIMLNSTSEQDMLVQSAEHSSSLFAYNFIDNSIIRIDFGDSNKVRLERAGESLLISGDQLNISIGFAVPSPPFIRLYGSDAVVRITKKAGFLVYEVFHAMMVFEGESFQEIVTTPSTVSAELNYRDGFMYVNLSYGSNYTYIDRRVLLSSFEVSNAYSDYYTICLRKSLPLYKPSDGQVDFLKHNASFQGRIIYRSWNNTHFVDSYDSREKENFALMQMLDKNDLATLRIENTNPSESTITTSSYFSILELADNRFGVISADKKPVKIIDYQTSNFLSKIEIGEVLRQYRGQSGNTVRLYAQGSQQLKEYEEALIWR